MDRRCILALTWAIGTLGLCPGPFAPASAGQIADPLADAQSHFAALGTNKVHYFSVGKGRQAILFVHGWACRGSFWRAQVPALSPKARLILIDLPGHGQSSQPHNAYTMDFFARAVLAVLADAKVDRATLAGHSMGVPVICSVYKQAPAKVAALVAVDGLLRRPPITADQAEQFIAPYRTADYRRQATRFITAMFPNAGTEALRDRVIADMLKTPQFVMAGAMEGMFAPGQPGWDLPKLDIPLLVINAQSPVWTPEYEAYARSLSPHVEYRTITAAGHFLMLEKPDEFNRLLLELLRKYHLAPNDKDH